VISFSNLSPAALQLPQKATAQKKQTSSITAIRLKAFRKPRLKVRLLALM